MNCIWGFGILITLNQLHKKLFFKHNFKLTRFNLRRKYDLLGEGCQAEVFDIGNNEIVKLNVEDDNYDYYEYCYQTKKKHLPKIKEIQKGDGYYLFIAEKLYPIEIDESFHIMNYLANHLYRKDGEIYHKNKEFEYRDQAIELAKLMKEISKKLPKVLSFDENPYNLMVTSNNEIILNDPY